MIRNSDVLKNLSIAILLGIFSLLPQTVVAELPDVASLAEKYAETVVNIATTTEPKPIVQGQPRGGQQMPLPFEGTPFEDMFKDFFKNFQPQQSRPSHSLGSGVVISTDGYVVTNNHVVEKADDIIVRLYDDTEYKAKVIGTDSKNDLALLKIKPKGKLPFAALGNSDNIRVGEWVVAIGNPFGLGGTVTAGIISARSRHIGQGPYDNFLQTDAAINPGNSGGPLFNMNGEVIGINTMIMSRSGGSQGIGFAIPSSTVQMIVEQIKEHGHPIRGWLGVKIQTVTNDMADALGLDKGVGALVSEVVAGSPAEKAKIKTGDLILTYDGKTISKMVELPRLVAQTPIGNKVSVDILRGGENKQLTVIIEQLTEKDIAEKRNIKPVDNSKSALGMKLSPLTDQLREQYQVAKDIKGVLVVGVVHGSAAQQAGVREGDILLRVNRNKVKTVPAAIGSIAADKGTAVLLLISRNGSNTFIPVRRKKDEN